MHLADGGSSHPHLSVKAPRRAAVLALHFCLAICLAIIMNPPAPVAAAAASNYHNPTTFTLRTGIAQGRMVYLGVGGDIDGLVNPTLTIHQGELIQINLINGEGAQHDISSTITMPGHRLWWERAHPRHSPSPGTAQESSPISAPLPGIDKRVGRTDPGSRRPTCRTPH